jgi:DNA-binding response OmpR family regulator
VVIADPDPTFRTLLRQLLQIRPLHLLEAGDGVTALALVRQEHPTLVILDADLPALDGWAVCTQIKSAPDLAATVVLLVTADNDLPAHPGGAPDAYLAKPFSLRALLARIDELIERAAWRERVMSPASPRWWR